MGTHPIFESDFDCLTECSLVSPLKLLLPNVVFLSAFAVCWKAVSANLPLSTSMLPVMVWMLTLPAQLWKTSLPPATKPIESPKLKILLPGMMLKWPIWKLPKNLSRLTHVTHNSLSHVLVVVIRNHGSLHLHHHVSRSLASLRRWKRCFIMRQPTRSSRILKKKKEIVILRIDHSVPSIYYKLLRLL